MEKSAGCYPGQYVRGLKYGFSPNGNQPKFLSYVQITCMPLSIGNNAELCLDTKGDGCWDRAPAPGRYNGYGPAFSAVCSPDNFMIGLVGRSGEYVDAIGIECLPKSHMR